MNAHAAATVLSNLSSEFLERYNRQGPRYTSYPTAPEWTDAVRQDQFRARLRADAARSHDKPLSLYFHIPFCEHRCAFCACNVIITKKPEIADDYLRYLDREMTIVRAEVESGGDGGRTVTQMHFGGGTPTFLSPEQLTWLVERIKRHFRFAPDAEMALEADPCVTRDEHLIALADLGFNRVSFGVQDFHSPTQQIIERVQTVEETEHLTELARRLGFASVNYDLVYGLPLQTVATFARTLDIVARLRPDRIALYNFAYLPRRLAHQRYLNPELFPSGREKFRIMVSAYERFVSEGYEYIGMDHFALPDDPLAIARRNRTIQRNFMGYTTQAGTDLYAFGVSSISATQDLYVQNEKKLSVYYRALDGGELPIERGFVLSDDDRLRRVVIYELMCHGRLVPSSIEERFSVDFERYFEYELAQLPQFERDGLLVLAPDRIDVTLLGHIFVRNIAMVFDVYLRREQPRATFSRTL
ncbi:oxygen-independent coproporphyrinogen III oxidase [bacterium]|nr:oxygen-independent coproporphyrinogen III oxidase [bacterium]